MGAAERPRIKEGGLSGMKMMHHMVMAKGNQPVLRIRIQLIQPLGGRTPFYRHVPPVWIEMIMGE
ncbi:hypothetical protein D3C86_2120600 [compost metagenome]